MTAPIVSILIASRYRFDRLKLAMKSFLDTAHNGGMEFVIRFHKTDLESLNRRDELYDLCNGVALTFIFGEDLKDGEGFNELYCQLVGFSKGHWIWPWSDDQIISGQDWMRELLLTPPGAIAHPEYHQLNESLYHQSLEGMGPVPCLPRSALPLLGNPPKLIDDDVDKILRLQYKWNIHLLKGVKVFHDRRIERTLSKEKF